MAIAIDALGNAPRHAAAALRTGSFHWHAYTAVFAATCVMTGVYWDISWHMSIGRDTFWTPAHLLIQAGGLIAGLSSGYVALMTTFRGTPEQRSAAVSFWGFKAPLGAWTCVWGCGAMLTSAPFDNWWHNAYGLDVRIISPPHALLAIGIFSIVVGALLLTLAQQNRADERDRRRLAWLLAATGGFLLMNFALFLTEYSERRMMHGAMYYYVMALTFPFALSMLARAIKLRWAATATAALFTAFMLGLMWVISLFPATPKLGPIYQHLTHMVTLSFPPLIIVPAFFIDLIMHRFDASRDGRRMNTLALAALIGPTFVATFVAVQWPFATFLVDSPLAQGRLFNADNFVYWMSPTYEALTKRFDPPAAWPIAAHFVLAAILASVASAWGLLRGEWMTRVRR
jgi:hypothetical protein